MNKKLSILLSITLLFSLQVQAQDHLWKFDEGAGSSSSDSGTSSAKVTATLSNAGWQSLASGGYAIHLDGTDASYVSFGNTIGQFGTGDFTVAFWYQTADKSLNLADVIGNRADFAGGNFFVVRMSQDGSVNVELSQDASGTNYIGVRSSVKGLNDGQWHHIAVTRSGKAVTVYVDGTQSGFTGYSNGVTNINNGRDLRLGRSLVPTGSRFSLNALYNDVMVYSVALTSGQVATLVSSASKTPVVDGCWLNSYGRGVGKVITACKDGLDKDGALCYPKCSSGYYGVGPVCWQSCPSGYRDDGAYCFKPSSYGRGAGYTLTQKSKCNNEHSQGCEKYGLLYYPKCAEGFSNAGCCVCSPKCPAGMTDIGVSCQKSSYGRGAGTPLTCASGLEEDAALCYTPCKAGFSGVGPVCWGSCPAGMYQCGALCLKSKNECVSKMLDIGTKALEGVVEVASEAENPVGAVISAAETVIDIASDLNYPVCPN